MKPFASTLLAAALLLSPLCAAEKPKPQPAGPPVCNRVRFQTVPATAAAGAKIEGSNVSRYAGFVTIAEIKDATVVDGWSEAKFENAAVYRWLRIALPPTAQAKVGKAEFYADDRLIGGDGKGLVFHPFAPGKDAVADNMLGYDLFDSATARRPAMLPVSGDLDGPTDVTLNSTPGAIIRYTLDGTLPTAERGEIYRAPIHVTTNTIINAAAFLEGRAASPPTETTYLFRGAAKPGLTTAHIGNSLTGTTNGFYRFARTAGYDQHSSAFLRPGALTREQWALASGTFTVDKLASTKEAQARQRGSEPWEEFWSKIGKVDLLTLQPRDFDLEKEVTAEIEFIKRFREKSPDLQPWLYCEWVELRRERPSDRGEVPSSQMKKTFPALTWQESMGAMLLYVEELQKMLTERFHEGKRPRVIPSALAMGWIKQMIDHGQFGGAQPGDFYPLLFNDQVHPAASPGNGSANGAYLVDLTWYSAFYREAPEGKVLPIETTFTPEQARIVERLAWEVIKNYPDCGLYEEGTQPCAKPEIAADGKTITLKSATPGAWFRYTLDGTVPTRTRGYVYCGVISVQPGIEVKAVAYKSGMADSEVASQ